MHRIYDHMMDSYIVTDTGGDMLCQCLLNALYIYGICNPTLQDSLTKSRIVVQHMHVRLFLLRVPNNMILFVGALCCCFDVFTFGV